jgi:hypothetical protein
VSVRYAGAKAEFELGRRPARRIGMMQLAPGQRADGYGRKISTDYMLRFEGEKRWRRVYCVQFSNCGTCYVVVQGERLYLEPWVFDWADVHDV